MKGYIYKYTFPDGKVYIGQTKNLEKRKRQHIDPVIGPATPGFWEAYCRYGKYEFEVIKELEYNNENELNYYMAVSEVGYIHQYHATDPEYGYNIMKYVFLKNKNKAILEKKYIEVLNKMLEHNLKVIDSALDKIWNTHEPLTEEEKVLIRDQYKETNPFDISFYDLDNLKNNREIDYFEEALLDDYLRFVKFKIIEETQDVAVLYVRMHQDEILQEAHDKTAIVQIDKEGNVIQEYASAEEICQVFNVPRADNVRNVLKGKQKTAYGYYWKYKRDL